MPVRVSVGRIITGYGDSRKIIEPNTTFDTDDYEVDAESLQAWDDTGVVRQPRDETGRASAAIGPVRAMTEGGTVEGRSGPVADATSDEPNKADVGKVVRPAADNRSASRAEGDTSAAKPSSRRSSQDDSDL